MHSPRSCGEILEKQMRNQPTNRKASRAAQALLIALLAGPALAHAGSGTIARLVEMSGSVLVSHDYNIASANEGLRLLPGTSVLTTANSAVIVEFDNGCRVKLERNQRFVLQDKPCLTLVQSTGVQVVARRGS
jgi:hypothetical protein